MVDYVSVKTRYWRLSSPYESMNDVFIWMFDPKRVAGKKEL